MDLGTTKMIARKEGGIGWMIFNQPEKHNAVSYEMWVAVPKIIAAFEADPHVRVIVLAGAGERAFVSGADISEFEKKRDTEEAIETYDAAGNAAHARSDAAAKPTICHDPRHLHRRRRRHRARRPTCASARPIRCSRSLPRSSASATATPASSGWSTSSGRRSPRRSSSRPASSRPRTRASWASSTAWCRRPSSRAYVHTFASTISGNAPLTIKAAKLAINAAVEDPERRRSPNRRRDQGLLCQRGLRRGPARLHGEAQAEVPGAVVSVMPALLAPGIQRPSKRRSKLMDGSPGQAWG